MSDSQYKSSTLQSKGSYIDTSTLNQHDYKAIPAPFGNSKKGISENCKCWYNCALKITEDLTKDVKKDKNMNKFLKYLKRISKYLNTENDQQSRKIISNDQLYMIKYYMANKNKTNSNIIKFLLIF